MKPPLKPAVLAVTWRLQLANKPTEAAELLKQLADQGLPLHPDVSDAGSDFDS